MCGRSGHRWVCGDRRAGRGRLVVSKAAPGVSKAASTTSCRREGMMVQTGAARAASRAPHLKGQIPKACTTTAVGQDEKTRTHCGGPSSAVPRNGMDSEYRADH